MAADGACIPGLPSSFFANPYCVKEALAMGRRQDICWTVERLCTGFQRGLRPELCCPHSLTGRDSGTGHGPSKTVLQTPAFLPLSSRPLIDLMSLAGGAGKARVAPLCVLLLRGSQAVESTRSAQLLWAYVT